MTIHGFIPAGPKHGNKTACGIKLGAWEGNAGEGSALALDGSVIAVSDKGKPFDCPRCRRVLEISTRGRAAALRCVLINARA
jgi:hypothetical protein